MAEKKSAKLHNNDDKEESGSTKGYEDICAMIQGLTLNMNNFIADIRKERENKINKEDLNRATDGCEVGIKAAIDLATEAQEQVRIQDKFVIDQGIITPTTKEVHVKNDEELETHKAQTTHFRSPPPRDAGFKKMPLVTKKADVADNTL